MAMAVLLFLFSLSNNCALSMFTSVYDLECNACM